MNTYSTAEVVHTLAGTLIWRFGESSEHRQILIFAKFKSDTMRTIHTQSYVHVHARARGLALDRNFYDSSSSVVEC